jgi:hypothetical protein
MAVDLALVTDVLPDADRAAKDLGVCYMADALPYAFAPAVSPAIPAGSNDSCAVLYFVAGPPPSSAWLPSSPSRRCAEPTPPGMGIDELHHADHHMW